MRSRRSALTALTTLWVASSISVRAQAACGDGTVDTGETCDDRNTLAGDGCNVSCQIEGGYVCSGAPSLCCFQDAAAAYALLSDASLDYASGIITLTPESTWKHGTAWYRQPLDFSNPFTISLMLYLGTRDDAPTSNAEDSGADGGSLLFQRDPRKLLTEGAFSGSAGEDGGELGAKGITPVLGVEFDTYNNGTTFGDSTQGDEDHTSVFQSGVHPASNQIAPAVCMNASTTCTNFEDGNWHRFDVSWSGVVDHHLAVSVDGVQRIDLDRNLLQYFANDPTGILFGMAASTGGQFNLQRFCPLAPFGFGVPRDRDGDAIDDALDPDSDGDGATDAAETANTFLAVDPDADQDQDGVPNYRDADYWRDTLTRAGECPDALAPIGECDGLIAAIDFDRDGIPDQLDLDADNDGTLEPSDASPHDPCMPLASSACPLSMNDAGMSMPDASAPVLDAGAMHDAGVKPPEGPTPGDVDGDQVANAVDVAPDDPCVPNKNALACAMGDVEGDGLSNAFECPGLRQCRDSDGDGVPDYADPDSDGDRLSDKQECPDANACPDSDGDGVPDLLQPALAKKDDGCALAREASPWSALLIALLMLSARTGSSARSATARACGARRSLPWFRAARRRPRATPRSS
jgi:cysteine-rich repeat protein